MARGFACESLILEAAMDIYIIPSQERYRALVQQSEQELVAMQESEGDHETEDVVRGSEDASQDDLVSRVYFL